jgi:hypothetical protein
MEKGEKPLLLGFDIALSQIFLTPRNRNSAVEERPE